MSLFAILTLAMVTYFAVLAAGNLLSHPLREQLVTLVDDMAAEPGRSADERAHLDWMATSSASSVIGLLFPVAAFFSMISFLLGAEIKEDRVVARLHQDSRYDRAVGMYFASVAACSPFAAICAAPFIVACGLIEAVKGETHIIRAVEVPILQASATFKPA